MGLSPSNAAAESVSGSAHRPGEPVTAESLFAGEGEMRALCRAFPWHTTPLGPVEQWSHSLRTTARTVLASRNPMFLWWGPELVQIYNDAYRPSFGAHGRHPRALGMRAADCWTDIWPTISPEIEQVMAGGEATWHEDQYLPIERNGRLEDVWWTYSYSAVCDDDGSIAGTLVVCQETTSRVLAEREREHLLRALELERSRLEDVFRRAPAFLAVLRGPEFVFELVNDAYYQLVGHRDLLGRPVFEAIPESRGQGYRELLEQVLATGEPFVGRSLSLLVARTPGEPPEERFIDLTFLPLVEPDGSRSGVIAHGADVTPQVLARREVERLLAESERARCEAEEARRAAEEADRAKAQFLATMSHELRTPLNAIQGHVQLLEMELHGPVTSRQRAALRRIDKSQRHLLGVVNDVLNYARLGSGRVEYRIQPIDIAQAVADVLPMIEPQLTAQGLQIAVDLPSARSDDQDARERVIIRADPEKLGQILLNLLSNAVKFTLPGGSITVEMADTDGHAERPHHAMLRISDTGIGIPRDKLEAVFEPFVQVRTEYTRAAGGTGLGLAISRDLARAMNGDLTAESTPGIGSSFTLTLPRA